ncbi:MAG: hypothetical protein ILA19_00365 [Bacilli bacterium]|nr:hypothetical protein [Bacilli bacterium]
MAKAKYEVTVGAPSLKPKKKKTVLWIILSLIIGILIGGGSLYYYDHIYKKSDNKKESNNVINKDDNKKQDNVKELNIDSYLVKKLMTGIHFKDGSISEKTLYIENKTNAKDLDSNYLDNLLLKEGYRVTDSFTDKISIKDLELARENLFGKNYEIIIPTDKEVGSCPVFNYDVANKIYNKSNEQCSLTNDIKIDYVTVSATMKEEDNVTVYERVAFIKNDGVYKKIDGSNNLSEKLDDVKPDDFNISENNDKLNRYKYIFKYDKDTKNYVFESVELVK